MTRHQPPPSLFTRVVRKAARFAGISRTKRVKSHPLILVTTGVALVVASLAAVTPAGAAGTTASARAATAAASASVRIPAPVHQGTLRIAGQPQDGGLVTAVGLRWSPGRLPRGTKLLSFAVAYTWQTCRADGTHCVTASDSAATPFAARQYRPSQPDTGRRLRVTETAAEVVETQPATFTFKVIRRSVQPAGQCAGPRLPAAPGAGGGVHQRHPGAHHRL